MVRRAAALGSAPTAGQRPGSVPRPRSGPRSGPWALGPVLGSLLASTLPASVTSFSAEAIVLVWVWVLHRIRPTADLRRPRPSQDCTHSGTHCRFGGPKPAPVLMIFGQDSQNLPKAGSHGTYHRTYSWLQSFRGKNTSQNRAGEGSRGAQKTEKHQMRPPRCAPPTGSQTHFLPRVDCDCAWNCPVGRLPRPGVQRLPSGSVTG